MRWLFRRQQCFMRTLNGLKYGFWFRYRYHLLRYNTSTIANIQHAIRLGFLLLCRCVCHLGKVKLHGNILVPHAFEMCRFLSWTHICLGSLTWSWAHRVASRRLLEKLKFLADIKFVWILCRSRLPIAVWRRNIILLNDVKLLTLEMRIHLMNISLKILVVDIHEFYYFWKSVFIFESIFLKFRSSVLELNLLARW